MVMLEESCRGGWRGGWSAREMWRSDMGALARGARLTGVHGWGGCHRELPPGWGITRRGRGTRGWFTDKKSMPLLVVRFFWVIFPDTFIDF